MTTIDERIEEWISSEPSMKRHVKANPKVKKELYRIHHVARKISECLVGQNADLELFILEEKPRQPIVLCSKCKRKVCKYDCGKKEYAPHPYRGYVAIDLEDGEKIGIDISPFYDGSIRELEMEKMYSVKGKIKEHDHKLYITTDEILSGNPEHILA